MKSQESQARYPGIITTGDGNSAVVAMETAASEAAGAYAITPATPMGEGWASAEKMFEVRLELADAASDEYFYGGRARVMIERKSSVVNSLGHFILWVQAKFTDWF